MKEYDVIVCGGGIAGISAALASSRMRQKVCLIERNALLGGLSTSGLINWYEPLCDGLGHQLINSNAEELLRYAIKYGYNTLEDSWLYKNNDKHEKRYATWFDPNLFALSLTNLLSNENVDIYFESQISEVHLVNNLISKIDIYTLEGKITLVGKAYVDATGSAYIFKQAKLETRNGLNYLTYVTSTYKNGLKKPIFQYSGASLSGYNHPHGLHYFTNANQKDINEYILLGQKLCLKEYEEGKIDDISMIPSMNQLRKISTIIGDYQLSKKDLCKHQKESIGVIGVFNKIGEWYELPIGILTNNKIKNLFAAGRIVSCSDEEAWEATRVIPVCALTGEVSGYLTYIYNNNLDINEIYNILKEKKIRLHY